MGAEEKAVELLRSGGWELDDAQARHRANPETFWLPSGEDLQRIEVGHAVRLILRLSDLADEIRDGIEPYSHEGVANLVVSHERMWLWVEQTEGDVLVGVLQNVPLATHSNLVPGSRVRFHLNDVIDFDTEPPVEMHEELTAMAKIGFPVLDEAEALAVVDRNRVAAIAPSQLEICQRAGVQPQRPWDFAKCLIDRAAADGVVPLFGARWKPDRDRGDCGWVLWSTYPDMQDAADDHGFDIVHIADIRSRCEPMWRFLALPPGWAFTIAPDGKEEVFRDPELLDTD